MLTRLATANIRIRHHQELSTPQEVTSELPLNETAAYSVLAGRLAIHRLLHGMDDRLLVVVGPCSIHDPQAAMDYASRLLEQRQRFSGELEIVMRVYFEKPRTTVGWKGLINDPYLDGSFKINEGLRLARKLLLDINAMGMPAGTEFLDMITPQYTADLIAWGAIGARTTESQSHREMASGLSCPVGFKNGTDGNVRIAVDAIRAAQQPHHFLAVTEAGRSSIATTTGNEDCHIILRGGKAPNYDAASVTSASEELAKAGLMQKLMIDFSHANSSKVAAKQMEVAEAVANQLSAGEERIMGVMVESHLVAGRQDHQQGAPVESLCYGQSITDACIGWEDSVSLLHTLADAVQARRRKLASQDLSEK